MGQVTNISGTTLRRPRVLLDQCTDDDFLEGVTAYLSGARTADVGRILKFEKVASVFSESQGLLATPEWVAACRLVLPAIQERVFNRLQSLESKTLTELDDRLENGDDAYNFEGVIVGKKQIRGKELAEIYAKVAEAKGRLLQRLKNIQQGDAEVISLNDLAKALTRLAREKDITPDYHPPDG